MSTVADILSVTAHRPYPLPQGSWRFCQEWNQSLFLHYPVSAEVIGPLIPKGVALDTFNGQAWISIVAFTMQKIRPKGLPAISQISDFHEINLRTYVVNDGKPGVYFLSMEGSKHLSVWVSKALSGLPYEKAVMHRSSQHEVQRYTSKHATKDFFLDVQFSVDTAAHQKTPLDKWLTERYCLYLDRGASLYRFDVHHPEWPMNNLHVQELDLQYKVGDWSIDNNTPYLAHYSPGVQVLAWARKKIAIL